MDNGDLVNEIGLLLTQLRYARRSLEDIERSTARYAGFAFASALAAGSGFGAPPMFSGALKVYVVNINDLAPGGGIGGFLEGLLGGVGRLFGGLAGGLVGGTIGGVALPVMIWKIENIAAAVERIIDKLGVPKEPVPKGKEAEAGGGGSFFDSLADIKSVITVFTALFQAASGKPEEAAKTAEPPTPWLAVLRSADSLAQGISIVIKGLTLLIPEVIGALAFLISRLDSIKLAILDLLQFVLREALLLRGVVLTVLFDTLAAAARLGANILAILGLTLQSVLTSVFGIFSSVFDAALAAIEFLSSGLQKTVDALLKWLVETVVTVLGVIGESRVFRVAVYAIEVLPYILPSLVQLVRDRMLGPTDKAALEDAKKFQVNAAASPSAAAAAATLPPFPSVSATLLDPAAVKTLTGTVGHSLATINGLVGDISGDTSKGLGQIGDQLDKAASDKTFNDALDKHITELRQRSDTLAGTITAAQKAAIEHPKTGLEAIADAYEKWLSSPGGLKALLDNITTFIKETPTSGPGAEKSLAAQAIGPSTVDRPRATVEIDDVIIQLTPPPEHQLPGGVAGVMRALSDHSPEEFLEAMVELIYEIEQRGRTFGPGALVHQA